MSIQKKSLSNSECICPTECDCQNPKPDDFVGTEQCWHSSDYCPEHNIFPKVPEDCPEHGSNFERVHE